MNFIGQMDRKAQSIIATYFFNAEDNVFSYASAVVVAVVLPCV